MKGLKKDKNKDLFKELSIWLLFGLTGASCANIGNPTGGARDEDPPRFVSANPSSGSLNVDRNKITLTFDELVNVKDPFTNVVVSPSSKGVPRITSSGRRVNIEFDSLVANTTYTIDFGNAIEDNNEGNKLQGFAYSFSTGPILDSLRISGRVLGARDMEPQQSVLVGVYPLEMMSDTTFEKSRMVRVAKTDDRGQFTIRGLGAGKYRIFALEDNDGDYAYSSPEENLAFFDAVVEPTSVETISKDTIYNSQTGKIDTIVSRLRTRYLPNDLLLRMFNSGLRQQYMTKYERLDSTRVFIKFNTLSDTLPRVRVLGRPEIKSPGVLERSVRNDSLVWWLTPELMRTDSLRLIVDYARSDMNLVKTAVSDTLDFFTRRPVVKVKNDKKQRRLATADSIAAITTQFKMLTPVVQDVHLPLSFEVATPLARLDTTKVRLSVLTDSVYRPVRGLLLPAQDGNPRKYMLDYEWDYGSRYKLEIDTIAGRDIYGKATRPLIHEFKVKELGDYCSVLFRLTGLQAGVRAFVELLNGSDAVVRVEPVDNGEVYFPFLEPGKYYARVIMDLNGNGEYDTGNYAQGLQPELAYYYSGVINLKKNWDREIVWNVWDQPADRMKPEAILKNKPNKDKRDQGLGKGNQSSEEDDDWFDPTVNPFDPNDKATKRHNNRTAGSY